MPYGKQQYDEETDTFVCEFPIEDQDTGMYHICGKVCQDLARHITNHHRITTAEYKRMLGINRNEKLISKRTQEKLRQINIEQNLSRNLKPEPFVKGDNTKQSFVRRHQDRQRLKNLHKLRKRKPKEVLKFNN